MAPVKTAFNDIKDVRVFAQAIVDTIRDPLLVLDGGLRVIAASRSFYNIFQVDPEDTEGRHVYALGGGQWNIPALRTLLEKILPEQTVMEGFEVDADFPGIGHRTMLLNSRKVFYEGHASTTLLLAFEDVTERRVIEREKEDLVQQKKELLEQTQELLNQKGILLQEMQHRIANSLQIIASILMLKAGSVTSDETREHLQDAHRRVMSVAAVQQHLQASGRVDLVDIAPYLSKLCETLGASMIADSRPISLRVQAEDGTAGSAHAVSIGLIVTELVINALKYAFPYDQQDGEVIVSYKVAGSDWKLTISDNGVGMSTNGAGIATNGAAPRKGGLGTSLVMALAQHLGAQVETASGPNGVIVSITHGAAVAWNSSERSSAQSHWPEVAIAVEPSSSPSAAGESARSNPGVHPN
jgi:two-component sensor histidine kinase